MNTSLCLIGYYTQPEICFACLCSLHICSVLPAYCLPLSLESVSSCFLSYLTPSSSATWRHQFQLCNRWPHPSMTSLPDAFPLSFFFFVWLVSELCLPVFLINEYLILISVLKKIQKMYCVSTFINLKISHKQNMLLPSEI